MMRALFGALEATTTRDVFTAEILDTAFVTEDLASQEAPPFTVR
jgi:hypothetical protein